MNEAPFQEAVGTSKSRWEWLEEKVTVRELRSKSASYPGFLDPTVSAADDEESVVSRPELENFGLAMVGGGRVLGTAHVYGTKEHILVAVIRLTNYRLPMGFT